MLSCAFAGADSVSERVQYNGAAPGAKIAFDDVGAGLSLSGIPWDLGDLFPHSYAAGARLHSDSWGSRDRYYDIMSMEIDQFTHDHDDYLVLVAAGNDGTGQCKHQRQKLNHAADGTKADNWRERLCVLDGVGGFRV